MDIKKIKEFIDLNLQKKEIEKELERLKEEILYTDFKEEYVENFIGSYKIKRETREINKLMEGIEEEQLIMEFPEAVSLDKTKLKKIPSAHKYFVTEVTEYIKVTESKL